MAVTVYLRTGQTSTVVGRFAVTEVVGYIIEEPTRASRPVGG